MVRIELEPRNCNGVDLLLLELVSKKIFLFFAPAQICKKKKQSTFNKPRNVFRCFMQWDVTRPALTMFTIQSKAAKIKEKLFNKIRKCDTETL